MTTDSDELMQDAEMIEEFRGEEPHTWCLWLTAIMFLGAALLWWD